MTRSVAVMAAPDPDTCTHEEWDAFLSSVDHAAMTLGELAEHRTRVELYTARIVRESDQARRHIGQLLDARDATNAEAEELSRRCRELYTQILEVGDKMLEARRVEPVDESLISRLRQRDEELSVALAQAQAALATANLRAIQATLDAR